MREAMAKAPVGDDVFGDDPTVAELEGRVAELLGKAAAVFVPSGTQSNLCGLLAHCGRGDEYIVGDHAHTYVYEGGGAAVLGSIQPQPVRMLDDGSLDLDHVREVVKPVDDHFARSRLLCLENTHDGKVQSVARMHESAEVGRSLGLAMHLDGARLWNASVALDVEPAAIAEPFDSVSVCLSKGLGAPLGSVLVGSVDLIREARKWRKMLGGGMRQVGVVAAAGLYAIENNFDGMAQDHANAERLAAELSTVDGVTVTGQNTNMVFANFGVDDNDQFMAATESDGVITRLYGDGDTRMVTHLDVGADDVDTIVKAITSAIAAQ